MHEFQKRLAFSEGIKPWPSLVRVLLDGIPSSKEMRKATTEADRNGTDWWIARDHGLPPVSVDVKHRDVDPIARWHSDDACIETTSVYQGIDKEAPWRDDYRKKVGWTLDVRKRTDLIVYTWPTDKGARRYWILYFPHLCATAIRNWRAWAREYQEKAVPNKGYLTLCVFPPRVVIARAMKEVISGVTL